MAKESTPTYMLLGHANSAINAAWNGSPSVLLVNQNLAMPQTPNGTTILSSTNQSSMNNGGTLGLTSGGAPPQFITVPANANQPSILIQNWNANNLSISNVSANNNTPILVQMVGPGIPGITPLNLPVNSTIALSAGQIAAGNANPQWMQLLIQSTAPTLGILGIIGGPPDGTGNNGYVIAVNSTANTGPGGAPPPTGYYATTTSNSFTFQFNWGSSQVFVANLSPSTAQALNITMRAL